MKLSPREICEVISQMKTASGFSHYVRMLEARKDEAVTTLLYCNPEEVETLRQRARVYDELLKEIKRADTIL